MSRKNRLSRQAQLSKVDRDLAAVERVLAVGNQAAGVHADQNRHRGGKYAKGGRGADRRQAIAQAS